jgi:alkaline phosphatase D
MTSTVPSRARRQLLLASAFAPLAGVGAAQASATVPGLNMAPDAPRLRIAFGSCARQDKPQPIWQVIAAAKPDLFAFLGDNLYADARDEKTLRQRYAEFRAVESLQAFRRSTPHVAIWDDHDFGDDDEGGDYPLKRLSQQLFCDEWGEAPDSPRRQRDGIYTSYRFTSGGRQVQLILLDLRYNRSALVTDPALKQDYRMMVMKAKLTGQPMTGWYVPNPDPQATMLGEAQWGWLAGQLAEPADLRIIGSSVQFAADGTGWEGWANFPLERQRFVDLVRTQRANGVVLLSGDMHYGEISRWPVANGYPLWDITSSGLTEVWDVPTPNRQRVAGVLAETNFGLLDVDWAQGQLTLNVCDGQGRVRLTQSLALDQLQFAHPKA